ncbi:MAG TPA: alkaline phosphatase family protein [Byssovorax sp.]|jgi:phospholipase C
MRNILFGLGFLSFGALACSSNDTSSSPAGGGGEASTTTQTSSSTHNPAGTGGAQTGPGGSGTGGGGTGGVLNCGGGASAGIEHVVVVVQENHTFDTYFGTYCTAAVGSNPTCNDGPACCEKAPAHDPSGASPMQLTDTWNATRDPSHLQACEISEIDGGAMDHYVTGSTESSCSDPGNFSIGQPADASAYQAFAAQYAIADRYFQPIAGQSSSNDMYLAVAQEVFIDNGFFPDIDPGRGCTFGGTAKTYTGQTTIADLLKAAGHSVKWYAEGWDAAVATAPNCPPAPPDCPAGLSIYPCVFSAGDIPFLYYDQWQSDPDFMQDYAKFSTDIQGGTLPDVTYIKAAGYHSEHPGYGDTVSAGEQFVEGVVTTVEQSCYRENTLVLVTWDEGGGYFDHVPPPPDSTVDGQPYGTRVPLIAVGKFAKQNFVSHVQMEHSSVVKFLEFLYLDGQTGQLGARDAVVNDIGSLLDETKTGITIPDQ